MISTRWLMSYSPARKLRGSGRKSSVELGYAISSRGLRVRRQLFLLSAFDFIGFGMALSLLINGEL